MLNRPLRRTIYRMMHPMKLQPILVNGNFLIYKVFLWMIFSMFPETKGSMNSMELREIEKNKIACAEKLFEQLSSSGVKYGKIDCYDTLMSLVK